MAASNRLLLTFPHHQRTPATATITSTYSAAIRVSHPYRRGCGASDSRGCGAGALAVVMSNYYLRRAPIEGQTGQPAYRVGSGTPASLKPRLRSTQLSHRPHARPRGSGS